MRVDNDIAQYMYLTGGHADRVVADAKEIYRQQRNFWALLATEGEGEVDNG